MMMVIQYIVNLNCCWIDASPNNLSSHDQLVGWDFAGVWQRDIMWYSTHHTCSCPHNLIVVYNICGTGEIPDHILPSKGNKINYKLSKIKNLSRASFGRASHFALTTVTLAQQPGIHFGSWIVYVSSCWELYSSVHRSVHRSMIPNTIYYIISEIYGKDIVRWASD